MNWHHAARRYQPRPRGAQARAGLVEAYRAVFASQAANEQQRQMVLADLASFTGFYRVSGPDIPSEARAFADGQRAAFGRLFRFLRLSEAERRELEEAARQEAIADAEYGEL